MCVCVSYSIYHFYKVQPILISCNRLLWKLSIGLHGLFFVLSSVFWTFLFYVSLFNDRDPAGQVISSSMKEVVNWLLK